MIQNSEAAEAAAKELVSGWLRSKACPCRFPAALLNDGGISLSAFLSDTDLAARLELVLDLAAERKQFSLSILAWLDHEEALADLVGTLVKHPRWNAREVPCGDGLLSVELLWSTLDGPQSNAVGFAPFGSMMPSRRAPFVCLGAWPARGANPHRAQLQSGKVGLADTFNKLSKAVHAKHWNASEEATQLALASFGISSKEARRVAYRLPERCRERVQAHLREIGKS